MTSTNPQGPPRDIVDQLAKLAAFHQSGALSQDAFDAAKAKVLRGVTAPAPPNYPPRPHYPPNYPPPTASAPATPAAALRAETTQSLSTAPSKESNGVRRLIFLLTPLVVGVGVAAVINGYSPPSGGGTSATNATSATTTPAVNGNPGIGHVAKEGTLRS